MPPSPWIGSTRTAAVSSSIAAATAPQIVIGNIDEARHHRLEAGVVLGLGGGGQRGEGPAVEAAFHRDDLVPALLVAVGPGQLDGGLVGLGAAVAEEALAAERPLRRGPRPEPWGSMYQVLGTWISRPTCSRTASTTRGGQWPEQVAAPAGEEVEIAVPLGVPDPRALAADQADGESPVVGDHVPIELGDRLLRAGSAWARLRSRDDSDLGRVAVRCKTCHDDRCSSGNRIEGFASTDGGGPGADGPTTVILPDDLGADAASG